MIPSEEEIEIVELIGGPADGERIPIPKGVGRVTFPCSNGVIVYESHEWKVIAEAFRTRTRAVDGG